MAAKKGGLGRGLDALFADNSIEEIASECGIADASYFNKVFRRIEGMTASQYRSMWKGGIKTRNLPQQD